MWDIPLWFLCKRNLTWQFFKTIITHFFNQNEGHVCCLFFDKGRIWTVDKAFSKVKNPARNISKMYRNNITSHSMSWYKKHSYKCLSWYICNRFISWIIQFGRISPPWIIQFGRNPLPWIIQFGRVLPPWLIQFGRVPPPWLIQFGNISLPCNRDYACAFALQL